MSLNPTLSVGSTAVLGLNLRPGTRSVNVQNNGTGTLYYNFYADNVTSPGLTTSNGIQITAGQGVVTNIPLTAANEITGVGLGPSLWFISGSTTTISVQGVPF